MRCVVLALSVIAGLTCATNAFAGTYDVWSCAGPSGEPLPATGWAPQSYGGTIASTCGRSSGKLSGSLASDSTSVGSFARWVFEAPPDTTIANVTLQRAAGVSGAGPSWYRSYFLFRDSPVPDQGYGIDVCAFLIGPCSWPGDPADPFGVPSHFTSGPLTSGRLIASAQCDGVQPCPAQSAQTAGWFEIYRARIALADAFPPVFRAPPTGSLLDASAALSGDRAVAFDASDRGGGLRGAEIVVDGRIAATTALASGATCREPFSVPAPCPATAAGTVALDTTRVENGQRRIQVALVDAAGNRALSDPVAVHIHNDKSANGTPATRDARITASFRTRSGRRSVERTVQFGGRGRITGRLVDARGTPVVGALLSVITRVDRVGADDREVARVVTGVDGRYSWRTSRGPSRLVRIGYRAFLSDERFSASEEVKLGVRPPIALSVRPRRVRNGGRIRFRGRLLSGPGRRGTQVVLEAVGRRARQRVPVATLRADRRGRFGFSYRFLRSFAPFTYRFRARLIPQATYPYAAGASPVVIVKIVR